MESCAKVALFYDSPREFLACNSSEAEEISKRIGIQSRIAAELVLLLLLVSIIYPLFASSSCVRLAKRMFHLVDTLSFFAAARSSLFTMLHLLYDVNTKLTLVTWVLSSRLTSTFRAEECQACRPCPHQKPLWRSCMPHWLHTKIPSHFPTVS